MGRSYQALNYCHMTSKESNNANPKSEACETISYAAFCWNINMIIDSKKIPVEIKEHIAE